MRNNGQPFVSVIIPVFNGASFLAETVKSIQKSTYKNLEIILVDDGSTDKSQHICQAMEKKSKNIHFYSFATNRGMDRVLNFALAKAKGKYICRINQDDKMLPKRIQTQVDFLEQNPQVVAVGSHIKIFSNPESHKCHSGRNEVTDRISYMRSYRPSGSRMTEKSEACDHHYRYQIVKFLPTDEEIKKFWLILSPFSDPSVMYRKSAVIKAGGYEQKFWPADDVHMWYRLGCLGKLANIQEPLVEVRWHNNAGSIKFFKRDIIVTYKLHLWADKNIAKANLFIHLFWLIQLICGLIFTPQFNWGVYRLLKRVINWLESTKMNRFSLVLKSKPAIAPQKA